MYHIDDIVNTVIHGDSHIELKKIPDESVDCIIIDPPYRYLKHKLDRPFNEALIFNELYRVLKPNSFLVIFGIGARLCRDIVMLEDIGFKCKEEVVWVKNNITNFMCNLQRRHESFYILNKGKRKINKIRNDLFNILYNEVSLSRLKDSYKSLLQALKSKKDLDYIKDYICKGIITYNEMRKDCHLMKAIKNKTNTNVDMVRKFTEGVVENTVIETVLKVNIDDDYKHGTQKPLELMSRIVKLVSNENDIILDCFAGSGSTLLGAIKNDRRYIGIEIDAEYYNVCINRIKEKQGLFYGKDI